MTVLAREIDAYKRAVEQYNRQIKQHNAKIGQYNDSLVLDADGNAVVRDMLGNTFVVDKEGKLSGYTLPDGRTLPDYGSTMIPQSNFALLRQNPTERNTERASGAVRTEDGGYQIPNSEGGGQLLGPEWRMVSTQEPTSEGGSPTYTFERDASAYMEKPGDFEGKLRASRPDPSMAQVRRMFNGSVADRERGGLVSEVIRGNGLATGGTPVQYRSGAVLKDPNQQQQPAGNTTPVVPPTDPDPNDPTRNTSLDI